MTGYKDHEGWRLAAPYAMSLKRNRKLLFTILFLIGLSAFLALCNSIGTKDEGSNMEEASEEAIREFEESFNQEPVDHSVASSDALEESANGDSESRLILKKLESALNTINPRGGSEIKFNKKKQMSDIIQRSRKSPTRNKNSPPNSCQKRSLIASRKDRGFQKAGDNIFVYSAYYNTRIVDAKKTFIKIVGIAQPNAHIYCHIWYRVESQNKRELEIVEASIEHAHQQGQNLTFESVVLKCKASHPPETKWIPQWVVLSDRPCGEPSAVLPVKDPSRYLTNSDSFAVCLQRPLTSDYTNVQQFLEWVEINRIFGAQRFYIYTYNISDIIMPYIQYYVDNDLLDYKEWNLPDVDANLEFSETRLAIANDCIFSNIHQADYLAMLDITAFAVTSGDGNLVDTLGNGPCKFQPAVEFSSVFFPPSAPQDSIFTSNADVASTELTSLSHTARSAFPSPCGFVNQMLVIPEMIFNHDQSLGSPHFQTCCMPATLAQLYHYRDWNSEAHIPWDQDSPSKLAQIGEMDTKRMNKLVRDRKMHQHAGDIIQGVADVYQAVDPSQYARFGKLTNRGSWSLS